MGPEEVLRRLEEWPRGLNLDQRKTVRLALTACRAIFESPRAILAWEEQEEPWLIVASLSDHGFTWSEEEPERYLPLVNSPDDDVTFAGDAVAIHGDFRAAFGLNDVISAPMRGEAVQGRLFVPEPKVRDLLLADMVGLLLERTLDYASSFRTASREAVKEERIRVARDLHDGLLQSFTGIVLRLETIHSLIETEPNEARRMITDIEGVIMADQRELRSYVEQLRPRRKVDVDFDFKARMLELQSRFETQWGVGVAFEIQDEIDPLLVKSLGPETFRIIQEAVTNSAKHGSASHVTVRLNSSDSRMRIEVIDDGSGFPFHGRMSLAAIRESGIGPAILAERVAALNGDLAVESSGSGARLEISVPLGISGAS
ncbi:MAG TPA: histidine kinase [Thermoanaerobaculia bacterium]|nr:histidine kinase [Thermoanaerobaculia bacterium]